MLQLVSTDHSNSGTFCVILQNSPSSCSVPLFMINPGTISSIEFEALFISRKYEFFSWTSYFFVIVVIISV